MRSAIFRAVAQKVALLEIIPGKGSGTLKRRVLAKLAQKDDLLLFQGAGNIGGLAGQLVDGVL